MVLRKWESRSSPPKESKARANARALFVISRRLGLYGFCSGIVLIVVIVIIDAIDTIDEIDIIDAIDIIDMLNWGEWLSFLNYIEINQFVDCYVLR